MLISVVMPTYKRPLPIKLAIQSVIDQKHQEWELLICHDGPMDDDVRKVITSFEDSRIRAFELPSNTNDFGTTPRNACLDRAKGDLIAYLDDDNQWLPDHLTSLIPLFDEYEIDFAFSGSTIYSKKNGEFVRHRYDTHAEVNHIDSSEIIHKPTDIRWRQSGYANDADLISQMLDCGHKYAKGPEITVRYFSRHE